MVQAVVSMKFRHSYGERVNATKYNSKPYSKLDYEALAYLERMDANERVAYVWYVEHDVDMMEEMPKWVRSIHKVRMTKPGLLKAIPRQFYPRECVLDTDPQDVC